MKIGKSLFDAKGAELAPGLLEKAKAKGCNIIFPCDWACGQDFCNEQPIKMVTQEEGIPDEWEGMDCGPESMELFRKTVLASATVIWNGPAGVFEFDNFSKGTKALLEAVAETTAAGNVGIIGGGDSATGKLFELPHVCFFAISSIVTNENDVYVLKLRPSGIWKIRLRS